MRAQKVLGCVFQIDGQLAGSNIIKQTKACIRQFRLVARHHILICCGKDLRATFTVGDGHTDNAIAV